MKLFSKYYFPLLLWAFLIFYLSSIPNLSIGEGLLDAILRSGAHVAEYLVFSLLLYRSFVNTQLFNDKSRVEVLLIAIAVSIVYAISDEWHQHFVPTRKASLFDIVLDSIGSFLGSTVIAYGKDLPISFRKRNG